MTNTTTAKNKEARRPTPRESWRNPKPFPEAVQEEALRLLARIDDHIDQELSDLIAAASEETYRALRSIVADGLLMRRWHTESRDTALRQQQRWIDRGWRHFFSLHSTNPRRAPEPDEMDPTIATKMCPHELEILEAVRRKLTNKSLGLAPRRSEVIQFLGSLVASDKPEAISDFQAWKAAPFPKKRKNRRHTLDRKVSAMMRRAGQATQDSTGSASESNPHPPLY